AHVSNRAKLVSLTVQIKLALDTRSIRTLPWNKEGVFQNRLSGTGRECLPGNRGDCCVGPVARILACFGIDHFEPGVMQEAAHLIVRPVVCRGNSMVERFCGLALESLGAGASEAKELAGARVEQAVVTT